MREDVLEVLADRSARVLVPGCGNAPFQLDMYDSGYTNMVCGDLSPVVIRSMQEDSRDTDRSIRWEILDATDMPYEDGSYDVVVDKSLFDCLRCCSKGTVENYFDEVFRVLAPGGLFLVLTCHREKVLRANLRGRRWTVIREENYHLTKLVDGVEKMCDEPTILLSVCRKLGEEIGATDLEPGSTEMPKQVKRKARKKAEKKQRRVQKERLIEAGLT